jgi:hypothetical protein
MSAGVKLPLTGGCQCGAVRYEIAAAPLAVYACHCTDCQRQSGGDFALSLIAPRESVRITKGTRKSGRGPPSMRRAGRRRIASCAAIAAIAFIICRRATPPWRW